MYEDPVPMHQLPALARMLREARQRAGLTREALAREAKVEPAAIYARMEEATLMPSLATLRRLCVALGLDYDELVKGLRGEAEEELHS
jgi:transcriptional regulator with XRE-family HTH domain